MEELELKSAKAKGGRARAASLTATERTNIAKRAAEARWATEDTLPGVLCGSPDRPLMLAGQAINCYVLEDGTRVLSQAGFLQALGRHARAKSRRDEEDDPELAAVPPLLQGQTIRPFVTPDIVEQSRPIPFRLPSGVRASGYRAELLPQVCEIYLRARDADVLLYNQKRIAKQAEILVRALANVGIIALVDEATGYQEVRAKDALATILNEFIAKELRPWLSTFPAAFYAEMFRLRGLDFPNDSIRRPQYFGILTNEIVYKRLAPGVLDELRRITPKNDSGRPRHKYFQRLTSNVGYPKLRELLGAVVAVMRLSTDWADFMEKLDRLYPRFNYQLSLPLYDAAADDGHGI